MLAMDTTAATRVGLADLVGRIREQIGRAAGARETALAVAAALREPLPTVELLTPEERSGAGDGYHRHTLYSEPGLSIAALVWPPGQRTAIHDHVAWCSFVVLQGVEYETLYRDAGDHLTEIGRAANRTGDASGFAPPGDIHRVHNTGATTAISLHVYGADIGADDSSVRRTYDLPVRPAGQAG